MSHPADHPIFKDMPATQRALRLAEATPTNVICPDGVRRHAEPFKTRAEADAFADYGHACMAAHLHTFIEVQP